VHIDSFPFLGRLAASGHVSSVRADASDVTVSRLRFSSIHVDLHDVEVDRRRLLSDRQVDIRAVGRGEATADVAQADLRQALGGLPVTLGDGRVTVTIRGVTVAVSATVRDNVLRLSAGPLTVPAITLPKLPLLPCITDAVARPGVLRLSCQVSRVQDHGDRITRGQGLLPHAARHHRGCHRLDRGHRAGHRHRLRPRGATPARAGGQGQGLRRRGRLALGTGGADVTRAVAAQPAAAGSTSHSTWSAWTRVAGSAASPRHTPAKASRFSVPDTVKTTNRARAMPE
jgi:hypothetical protein